MNLITDVFNINVSFTFANHLVECGMSRWRPASVRSLTTSGHTAIISLLSSLLVTVLLLAWTTVWTECELVALKYSFIEMLLQLNNYNSEFTVWLMYYWFQLLEKHFQKVSESLQRSQFLLAHLTVTEMIVKSTVCWSKLELNVQRFQKDIRLIIASTAGIHNSEISVLFVVTKCRSQ